MTAARHRPRSPVSSLWTGHGGRRRGSPRGLCCPCTHSRATRYHPGRSRVGCTVPSSRRAPYLHQRSRLSEAAPMRLALRLPAFALATACLLTGCGKSPEPVTAQQTRAAQPQVDAADTIYAGGDIVTVDDRQPKRGGAGRQRRQDRGSGHARRRREGSQGRKHRGRGSRWQGAVAGVSRRAQPLRQFADRRQPGEPVCAAGRAGKGPRQHRRRTREVPRCQQDSEGRGHPGLRLRRERHAGRAPAQPRRPRQGTSPTIRCWSGTSPCTARY